MSDMNKEIDDVLISVVMPVFNAGNYLAGAIDSILNQTFGNFEFVIINDGSTDGSKAVIEQYASQDHRIRAVHHINRGISITRNEGLRLARGRYIAWMDADDFSMPERLATQYTFMEQHPDVVATGTGVRLIDPDGEELCDWDSPESHDEIDAFHMNGKGGAIIFPSSMMIKDAVVKAGGFRNDVTAAEDVDLFLRLAEIGKLMNIGQLLLLYRQHEKSISHRERNKVSVDTRTIIQAAYERRGLEFQNVHILSGEQKARDIYSKWAWWALSAGNVRTARKHALRAFWSSPFRLSNLKLLACVTRGY